VLIITNTSIKNNIATSVSHIYKGQKVIAKSVYHAINITSIKTELFAIRCEINYAVQLQGIACIIVITDVILAAEQIFGSSIYLYQLHFIVISKNLRCFFKKNSNNMIAFWNCLDSIK